MSNMKDNLITLKSSILEILKSYWKMNHRKNRLLLVMKK